MLAGGARCLIGEHLGSFTSSCKKGPAIIIPRWLPTLESGVGLAGVAYGR